MTSTALRDTGDGRYRSLRSKVIGTLLSVFIIYSLAAWFVLEFVQTPAFDRIELSHHTDQLNRAEKHLESERAELDLHVYDWAQWDDAMEFVLGGNNDFLEDNLSNGNLHGLGISFSAIFNREGRQIWGEAYLADKTIKPLEYLFPDGIKPGDPLLRPMTTEELVSGLTNTAHGPAIISSGAIFPNNGSGQSGGHMIAGKLLDAARMKAASQSMLTPIGFLPIDRSDLPTQYHQAHDELTIHNKPFAIVRQPDVIYALKLLKDIKGQQLAILKVTLQPDISTLGARTQRSTISILLLAALILTLTLWLVLKDMLLLPIERLTAVLRGVEDEQSSDDSGQSLLSTVQHLDKSRGLIATRNDELGELINAFDDLSISLRKASDSVWRAANIDRLTGLPNRRLFVDRLTRHIDIARENERSLAVLFIDLDDFKIVNDQLGHDAGDQLLTEVAQRLQTLVDLDELVISPYEDGPHDLVGRIGGDEFVVLLATGIVSERANKIAARIVEEIASPFDIKDQQCHIGACVGLALLPDDAKDLYEVLSRADAAMYEAKRAGKGSWRRYIPGLSRPRGQRAL